MHSWQGGGVDFNGDDNGNIDHKDDANNDGDNE